MKVPLEIIDGTSGIYFLCKNEVIVYIGRATDIFYRINSHVGEKTKEFDSTYFIRCAVDHLVKLEQILIDFYKPKYNIKRTKGYREEDFIFAEKLTGIDFKIIENKTCSN